MLFMFNTSAFLAMIDLTPINWDRRDSLQLISTLIHFVAICFSLHSTDVMGQLIPLLLAQIVILLKYLTNRWAQNREVPHGDMIDVLFLAFWSLFTVLPSVGIVIGIHQSNWLVMVMMDKAAAAMLMSAAVTAAGRAREVVVARDNIAARAQIPAAP